MAEDLYKCPTCGWTGTESDMESDESWDADTEEEHWSFYICPGCKTWCDGLEDYEDATNDHNSGS